MQRLTRQRGIEWRMERRWNRTCAGGGGGTGTVAIKGEEFESNWTRLDDDAAPNRTEPNRLLATLSSAILFRRLFSKMASFNFNMMSKQRKGGDEKPRNGYMNLFKVPKLQMPTEVPDSQFGQTPVFRKPFAPPPRPSPATSTPFFESSERSSAPFFNMDSQFGKTQTQTQTQSQNQTQPDFFGNVGDLNFDSLEIISQASSCEYFLPFSIFVNLTCTFCSWKIRRLQPY